MNIIKQIIVVVAVWTMAYVFVIAPAFDLEQPIRLTTNIMQNGAEVTEDLPQETVDAIYAEFLKYYPLETALCMRDDYSLWIPKQTRYVGSVGLNSCNGDMMIHTHPTTMKWQCPPSDADVSYAINDRKTILGIVCGTPKDYKLIFYNVSDYPLTNTTEETDNIWMNPKPLPRIWVRSIEQQ